MNLSRFTEKNPATVKPHIYPQSLLRSAVYTVTVNGIALDVLAHSAAQHTAFEADGEVSIEIKVNGPCERVMVRPLRLGIAACLDDGQISFKLQAPQNIQVEIEGAPLLYIYALAPVAEIPAGPNVRRFEAGKIHDAGLIVLKSGDVCWIEPGAVVRGSISASNASGVRVGGYGILEGSFWLEHLNSRRKCIVFDHCSDSQIENVLLLSPCHWMVVLGDCDNITVSGVREIADDVSSDGVDIVGSRNIHVTGCCLHNGDDNIAIKATTNRSENPDCPPGRDWVGTVENVLVSNCLFYNIHGGTAMEIGYETTTEHIRNIRFENNDVLAVHQFGAVFGIHNGDRAHVENVVWDNIRIEHHFDTLVDFRVLQSRWNIDAERGHISNVTLKNIHAMQNEHNAGYTLSIISGYNCAHSVKEIHFENFELGGRQIHDADMLDLVTRNVSNITFC